MTQQYLESTLANRYISCPHSPTETRAAANTRRTRAAKVHNGTDLRRPRVDIFVVHIASDVQKVCLTWAGQRGGGGRDCGGVVVYTRFEQIFGGAADRGVDACATGGGAAVGGAVGGGDVVTGADIVAAGRGANAGAGLGGGAAAGGGDGTEGVG